MVTSTSRATTAMRMASELKMDEVGGILEVLITQWTRTIIYSHQDNQQPSNPL